MKAVGLERKTTTRSEKDKKVTQETEIIRQRRRTITSMNLWETPFSNLLLKEEQNQKSR